MAYNEGLAERIRAALVDRRDVSERKMFGGLSFMLRGNMCCGVEKTNLMVRVGPEAYDEALAQPGARLMDFTGRPMKGMVFVGPEGYESDDGLRGWVERGVEYALSLPAK